MAAFERMIHGAAFVLKLHLTQVAFSCVNSVYMQCSRKMMLRETNCNVDNFDSFLDGILFGNKAMDMLLRQIFGHISTKDSCPSYNRMVLAAAV